MEPWLSGPLWSQQISRHLDINWNSPDNWSASFSCLIYSVRSLNDSSIGWSWSAAFIQAHRPASFSQDKSLQQPSASINRCHTPKRSSATPLHVYISVFGELEHVQIIEVPDKRDPDKLVCNGKLHMHGLTLHSSVYIRITQHIAHTQSAICQTDKKRYRGRKKKKMSLWLIASVTQGLTEWHA